MRIGELFLTCRNIYPDTTFLVYYRFDVYNQFNAELAAWRGVYDDLPCELETKKITSFLIEPGEDVVYLLYAD